LIKNALEPIGWYQARLFEDDREDNVYGDCRTQFELARAIFSITYQYGLKTGRQIRGVLKTPDGLVFSLGKLGINVDEWDCYKCMEFSLHINASEFVEETNKKSGANLEPTEKMKGESR
jgi:hypothetical protein